MGCFRLILFVVVCTNRFLSQTSAELRPCKPEDYHYEYTQCDENGKRWRVAVPTQDVCTPTISSYNTESTVPVNGTNCKTECDKGEFLSLESQRCVKCKAGTYSSGSTTKFDDWTKLPPGFSVNTESFQSYTDDKLVNCTNNIWTPKGSYISVTPGICASKLILSISLAKAGELKFEYQYLSSGSLFHVTVQNDQCQSSDDKDANVWPELTKSGKWGHKTMQLKSGFNVINWRVIGLRVGSDSVQPVMLRKVDVSGMAFSSTCAGCTAGTFSSDGASECTSCPPNTFSSERANFCSPCNAKTQYSGGGATECETRPPCKSTDYYHLYEPCNEDGKTRSLYQWIQPIICNSDLLTSVKLPASSDYIQCHKCNPGMHPVNGSCTFCPREHHSNGSECLKCKGSTSPDYGIWYQNWNSIPEGISTVCVSFSDSDCNNDTTWLPFGDHLSSHFARGESAYLVLQIRVAGFRTSQKAGSGSSVTVGQVTFLFETICSTFCQLVFLSDESGSQDIIVSWETAMPKTKYVHDVKKNGTFTYVLAFQNSGWFFDAGEVLNNTARIYSIEVTNTISGGAQTCQKCPKGSDQDGCIPCPDGHYIDNSTVTCVKCPTGTVVYSHKSYGANSCKACGPGLQVYQGRVCMSDGSFTSDQGRHFDLRNLTSSRYLQGSRLFASSGMQYYHGFNISLFGKPETSQVTCTNNVSQTSDNDNAMREPKSIHAQICRSTMVPVVGSPNDVLATQATSLGDHLTAIKHNDTQEGSIIGKLYNTSGFDSEEIANDIQVYFAAETPTSACPDGRKTVVSLRCDADQKDGGEIYLPPKCPDGTCDGCTFHFMLKVRDACPVCKKEDFKEVIGECVQGSQVIHYLPPQHCIIKEEMVQITQSCTVRLTALPFFIQILIPVFIGIGMIMFCLICFFWRKNKKLEYSYMKLKENHGGYDEEELPGVESCAVEEGDLDEQGDSVEIKDSKGARFFKKLTNKIKRDDAFDSTLMNERMPLT